MGSIMGALYASGKSGAQIRKSLEPMLVTKNDNIKNILSKTPDLFKWLGVVRLELNRGGLLKADTIESVFEQSKESMLDLKRQLIEKGCGPDTDNLLH